MQVNTYYYKNNSTPIAYVIKNLFSKEIGQSFKEYYKLTNMLEPEDPRPENVAYFGNANTFATYCDDLGVSILESLSSTISKVLNKEILPSYVYTRVYTKGAQLISHRDRDSCEISVTVSLCNEDNTREEYLYISEKPSEESTQQDILQVPISTGDALIFFGSQDNVGYYHWRDVTESEFILQSFLHYVTVNGKYASNAYEWKNE
jgi:hypothetical protein